MAAAKGSLEGDTPSSVQSRIISLLSKSKGEGATGLDRDALNLVTTPEYNNLRANIINHLKRQTVQDDAEGKAGRSPEESLNTGRRSQIRFQPTRITPAHQMTLRRKRNSVLKSGTKKLERMMNRGGPKVGSAPIRGNVERDTGVSPMGEGLKLAIRKKFRKNPKGLFDKRKVKGDLSQSNVMRGLMQRSRKNFKNKQKAEKRKALDFVPF